MSRPAFPVALAFAVALLALPARAQLVAEQLTPANASALLFTGTDADGGIDDWYLSNGVVEVVIDDVGPQEDLPPGVDAPPKQNEAAFTGGSVLDLGRVGADNDQLAQMFTVGGLNTSNFVVYDAIRAFTTGSSATVEVSGSVLGFGALSQDLDVVTQYTVAPGDPFLTITTTVTNGGSAAADGFGGFLDVFTWTDRAIVPFSPLPDRGFDHVELDLSNPVPALELPAFVAGPGNVGPEDGVIDPPSGRRAGEVAYGVLGVEVRVDGDGPGGAPATVIPANSLFGVNSSFISAIGNSPPIGSLAPGASLTYQRRLYVGTRNDVAAVANVMIEELAARRAFATGTISGDIDASDGPAVEASAVATRTGGPAVPGFAPGAPLTHFRTDASGAFSGVVLPAGTYEIEIRAPERDPVVVSGVTVAPGADTEVAVPPLSGRARVALRVREAPGGGPVPAKVTFQGVGDTPDPRFQRDFEAFLLQPGGAAENLRPWTFGGGPAQHNFAYLASGELEVEVRPGTYDLFASRGPEYTVQRRRIEVDAGETQPVRFTLQRIVETPGALSGDFHIHSARSLDASAPLRDRVATFAAAGVEVMVSTDHDYHTDYQPLIEDLGLEERVTSMVGDEVTTSVPNPPAFPDAIGHMNAWPVPSEPLAKRDGAVEDEFVAPNFVFLRLRRKGAGVIQYNHPRAGVSGLTSIGFFNNIGYDPDRPIDAPPNDILLDDDVTGISGVANPAGLRNIDFDVMEVINGTSVGGYLEVRRDWLSLLSQRNAQTASGPVPFIPATGVSDSHRLTLEAAGYARTYVRGVSDAPGELDVAAFNRSVKAGNTVVTTGPYIEATLVDGAGREAGLGETFVPQDGTLRLRIRVQASNWIPVEEVRVLANGAVRHVFDATTRPRVRPGPRNPLSQGRGRVVRFEAEVPLDPTRDTYFLVEAGAKLDPRPSPPPFIDRIVPGMVPLAFTNPVFVDLDGDGFDPPGLPVLAATERPAPGVLSKEERKELHHHKPIHGLRIPRSAADAVRRGHGPPR